MKKEDLSQKEMLIKAAEADLATFIRLVHPDRMLGRVHVELIHWWTRDEAKTHQLVLLPRDHQKSAMIAYRVAWELTRDPSLRILYISSTAKLAKQQLRFIKDILTSERYRFFWPDMVNIEEGQREKWTETEICVDHPYRKEKNVRDPSIFIAGLTTNIVGLHCDIAVLDDVVVHDTAYSEEGRGKVRTQVSYLSSIAGTEAKTWAVGTRYHPKDLYEDFQLMKYELFDEDGSINVSEFLFETFERKVEDRGDGTGQYLWPRQQALGTTSWYGFNQEVLAKKKAQYSDLSQFRAQYYNDPNDLSTSTISSDMFQYYDKSQVYQDRDKWFFKNSRLNVFAAIDFAFSLNKKADFTCITVVGVDSRNNYFVLDIERFKTTKISDYFEKILRMYNKWNFRKLRAEVTVAQQVIVEDLKNNYIRPHGLAFSIDEFRPLGKEGTKEERIEAILQPKYANRQVWHYSGGNCAYLEEELIMQRPPHDDIKDSLASAIDICIPPSNMASGTPSTGPQSFVPITHNSRFGGYG